MSIGLLYWIVFILGFIFGIAPAPEGWRYWRPAGSLVLLILLFLLGWRNFGFIIHD